MLFIGNLVMCFEAPLVVCCSFAWLMFIGDVRGG